MPAAPKLKTRPAAADISKASRTEAFSSSMPHKPDKPECVGNAHLAQALGCVLEGFSGIA